MPILPIICICAPAVLLAIYYTWQTQRELRIANREWTDATGKKPKP